MEHILIFKYLIQHSAWFLIYKEMSVILPFIQVTAFMEHKKIIMDACEVGIHCLFLVREKRHGPCRKGVYSPVGQIINN